MENTDELNNYLPEEKKGTTQFLKVLTILTFIACAYQLYQTVSFYISGEKQITKMEEQLVKMEEKEITGFAYEMTLKGIEISRIRLANNHLFFITDLIGVLLCAFGAFQMRKLQKTGYYLWLAGEFIPMVVSVIILTVGVLGLGILFMSIAPIAFAIMYGTQLKHMED
jgi:type III secretory pathway component EscR